MLRLAESVESVFNRRSNWIVAILVGVFLGCNLFHASNTLYWFDEIFTLYIARLPDLDGIWRALAASADGQPPSFFLISKTSAQVFGWTPLGLRLPEVLGYLVMMLCVYCIVRRYTTPVYAFIAMLGSYLTRAPAYIIEARPYGLLLGFSSLALLFWTRSTEGRKRPLSLAILCLSLAAALSCHYYAALTFFGLAAGEAARIWTRKRIDWAILASFALATTPVFLVLPLVRVGASQREYAAFSPPTLASFYSTIADLILPLNGILIFSLALLLFVLLRFARGGEAGMADGMPASPMHQWVAWIALALAPVEALALGKLVTGTIVGRYFIGFVIGFSILLGVWMYRAFHRSAFAGLAILCLCLFWFAVRSTLGARRDLSGGQMNALIQQNNPSHLPVAVADAVQFLQLEYYAPNRVRPDLVYLIDPLASMRYVHSAPGDLCLKGLRGVAAVNVPDYAEFVHSHKSFLMLWGRGGWLPWKLQADGARITLLGMAGIGALYSIEFE